MNRVNLKERRQSTRAKRVLSIEYRPVTNKKPWSLSTTEDMSLGGLSFYSDQEFRAGSKLEIRVVMSGVLDIYKGNATVVRTEHRTNASAYFVAVKFDWTKKRPASSYQKPSKTNSSAKKSVAKKK